MKRSQQREWVFKLIYEDSINKISDVEKALAYHGLEDEDFIRDSINSYNENYEKIEKTLKTKFLRHSNQALVSKGV